MMKKNFINFIVKCGALKFGEFITKSGRKSPYFINCGNFSNGSEISEIGSFFAEMISKVGFDFDLLFGPAYKAIPLVVSCCNALFKQHNINKPFFFNRKEIKDHGEKGFLIGHLPQNGDEIAIVEDVLTAGTSIRETIASLSSIGNFKINKAFVLVDRCEVGKNGIKSAATELYEEFGIKVHSFVNMLDIREFILNDEFLNCHINKIDTYINKYCVFD